MREVKVKASSKYSVFITSGGDGFTFLLDTYKMKKIFIVTDERVFNLYGKLIKGIENRICGVKVIGAGEESKKLETIVSIYKELIDKNVDRKTAIVAFGGGVVGDLAGFVASTYMRGVPFVQVPTTLMAQCDSSIGGKNGFNFEGLKNIVGTFYQPQFVYSDVNFIKTLDERDYNSGISEIIKYGFISDHNLFNYIEENKVGIKEREVDKLIHMIFETSKIKAAIVEKDEHDSGVRHVLNYGHTIGHAIESLANFKISHGEAVALGMNIEALISFKMGYINEGEYNRLLKILKYFNLPVELENMDVEELINLINHDKKKISNNIKFALPEKIGHAIITSEIKQNTIREAIKEAMRRKS